MNTGKLSRFSQPRGFTVVELLIVIVVIAILAAITIVAYTGIQTRTQNIRTIANVRAYLDALETYHAIKGSYPPADGEGTDEIAMVCLGKGYKNGTCGVVTDTDVYESTSLESAFADIGGPSGFAAVSDLSVEIDTGEKFTGAAYGIDNWWEGGRARTVQWVLQGENQDCVVPGSYVWNVSLGNTACEIALESYP